MGDTRSLDYSSYRILDACMSLQDDDEVKEACGVFVVHSLFQLVLACKSGTAAF